MHDARNEELPNLNSILHLFEKEPLPNESRIEIRPPINSEI